MEGEESTRMLRKSLSPPSKAMVKRPRTSETRAQVYEVVDRDRRRAVTQLERLSEKLVLTEAVTERARKIYMKASDRGLVKGRSMSGIMAASLYAACRERRMPLRLKDVAVVSNVEKKDIARCYRLLLNEMDFKMPATNPTRYVSVIASRAGISRKTMRTASGILKKADKAGISAGKDPAGLAAAALLVASTLEGEDRSQKNLVKAAGVTEVTIRNRYKDLWKLLA